MKPTAKSLKKNKVNEQKDHTDNDQTMRENQNHTWDWEQRITIQE